MLVTKRCENCKIYRKFEENRLNEKIIIEDKFYCSPECLKEAVVDRL